MTVNAIDIEAALREKAPEAFGGTSAAILDAHPMREPGDGVIPEGQRDSTLTAVAGALRRKGLSPEAIAAALHVENRRRCRPPLSDFEVEKIARSIGRYPSQDDLSGPVVLDPADPVPSARAFLAQTHTADGFLTLRRQGEVFYAHHPGCGAYLEQDEAAVRAALYGFLEAAQAPDGSSFKPTRAKVENVLDAVRALTNLPRTSAAPCWLADDPGLDPLDMLPLQNGLLHIPSRRFSDPTPRFFSLNGLTFAYDPDAPEPSTWLAFLRTVWPEDVESRQTLQEWIGYLLTPRTKLQKIAMLVGPKRAGKGTIARVVRRLLGDGNVCGPTLSNMAEPFGLSVLIGKSVAIIADARIGGRADTSAVAERLLAISGEDTLSVARKFLPDWNGRLSTRFMLLTNELPRIEDASGALASRFLVLRLTESFYGREDHELEAQLIPELPGILNWALEGYDRLAARGRFVQPQASEALIRDFEDLGSPISAFFRDRCDVGGGVEVMHETAFEAWKSWCRDNGREHPGTVQTLGRNLRAALPWLETQQHRVLGKPTRVWVGVGWKRSEAQ